MKQISALSSRVAALEEDNLHMKEQLAQQALTTTNSRSFRDVVAEQKAVQDQVTALHQKVTSSSVVNTAPVTELFHREHNKSKLVLFNLPETDSLEETVTEAFALIGQKPRFQASRLGKPGSNPRPVLVTLPDQSLRMAILKNCGKLKGQTTFPDLSARFVTLQPPPGTLSGSAHHCPASPTSVTQP